MSIIFYIVSIILGAATGAAIGIFIPIILATFTALTSSSQGSPYWIFLFFTIPIGVLIGGAYGISAGHLLAQSTEGWGTLFTHKGLVHILPIYVIGSLTLISSGFFLLKSYDKSQVIRSDIQIHTQKTEILLQNRQWKEAVLSLKAPFNKVHLYMNKHLPTDWINNLSNTLLSIPEKDIQEQKIFSFVLNQIHSSAHGGSGMTSFEYPSYVHPVLISLMKDWDIRGFYSQLNTFEHIKLKNIFNKPNNLPNQEILNLKSNHLFHSKILLTQLKTVPEIQNILKDKEAQNLNLEIQKWGTPMGIAILRYSTAKSDEEKSIWLQLIKQLQQLGAHLGETEKQNPLLTQAYQTLLN